MSCYDRGSRLGITVYAPGGKRETPSGIPSKTEKNEGTDYICELQM